MRIVKAVNRTTQLQNFSSGSGGMKSENKKVKQVRTKENINEEK
jgi:hypothetical protein